MKIKDFIDYEQPNKYIVESERYSNEYDIPVLTAGQSFILGYTNEIFGIYEKYPCIIFDDFTTSVHYVDFSFKVKSSAMKILKNKENSDLKYCYYLLLNMSKMPPNHKRQWISTTSEKKHKLPSINDQRKITNVLDKISNIINFYNLELKKFDELIKARFVEMFGNPKLNPMGWEQVTLEEACTSIVRGPFGSALKKEFFVEPSESTYKVYEQKHAIQKSATIGAYYITEQKFKELKRFECFAGDILMSCSGTMGELYQLPKGCERGIINQALCKFTLNNEILPIYFLNYMKQIIGNLETKGSGIKNIAAVSYVKQMSINLPPIELQNKFADFVRQVDKSKFEIQKSLEKTQQLYDSLMQKYFG